MLCHSVCRIAYEDYEGIIDNLKMLMKVRKEYTYDSKSCEVRRSL
jgi:hypothetical protein